jgi:hypothetical protein
MRNASQAEGMGEAARENDVFRLSHNSGGGREVRDFRPGLGRRWVVLWRAGSVRVGGQNDLLSRAFTADRSSRGLRQEVADDDDV